MTLLQIIVLACVQDLAERLPVSSSAQSYSVLAALQLPAVGAVE